MDSANRQIPRSTERISSCTWFWSEHCWKSYLLSSVQSSIIIFRCCPLDGRDTIHAIFALQNVKISTPMGSRPQIPHTWTVAVARTNTRRQEDKSLTTSAKHWFSKPSITSKQSTTKLYIYVHINKSKKINKIKRNASHGWYMNVLNGKNHSSKTVSMTKTAEFLPLEELHATLIFICCLVNIFCPQNFTYHTQCKNETQTYCKKAIFQISYNSSNHR